jgi:hypothetical protein
MEIVSPLTFAAHSMGFLAAGFTAVCFGFNDGFTDGFAELNLTNENAGNAAMNMMMIRSANLFFIGVEI